MTRRKFFVTFIFAIATIAVPLILHTKPALAANASEFRSGNIIDDSVFFNSTAMNPTQIQNFLNAKVTTCDTNGSQIYSGSTTRASYGTSKGYPPPYTCLKDYSQSTPTKAAEAGLCDQYNGGVKNSAQIIYDVSRACGINPQVLLVVLQKEQSLISDTWPWSIQYRSATGFGCPDTAPCDSEYYGFFNQVYHGARIYKKYARDASQFNYRAGRNNNILYNPNAACGSTPIFLTNQATAGLYNYTPYQPNAAALNNLYGTGDACSAYGNRNFWRMFTDWFGNTNLPTIIKPASGTSIYIQANGYKFYVPSFEVLNEFGLNTGPQTIDDNTFNSIPLASPSNGHSSSIGTVVKSPSDSDDDGGSIYLVTGGRKFLFRTTQQMADFGYDSSSISYLPLAFINSIPSDGVLSNSVQLPGSSFFQINSFSKRLITDSVTYQSVNTDGNLSRVSNYLVSQIPSGDPLAVNPIMLASTSGTFYLYTNNSYYYITSPDALDCWNFGSNFSLYPYRLPNDSYIAPVVGPSPLNCTGVDSVNDYFVFDRGKKIAVPSIYGFSKPAMNSALTGLIDRLPVRSNQLGRALKAQNNPVVWYLEGGARKPVPSTLDFSPLGITSAAIDTINDNAANSLPSSGIKLSVGSAVKATGGASIYIVTSDNEKTLVATPEDFVSYGYRWGEIRNITQSVLDASYPTAGTALSRYLYTDNEGIFLMDSNSCYGLTSTQAQAYGRPLTAGAAGQSYSWTIFPYLRLVNCTNASIYIKASNSPTIYQMSGGVKQPISTWGRLVTLSQQSNPYVLILNPSIVASFTTGSTL